MVGLGVGAQHARAYAAAGRCELRWLCDRDVKRAEALAAELGQGQATASFEEILGDPAVQAVSVASYDHHHAAQVIQLLDAGKHVLVEKPLGRTHAELEAIHAAWARHGGRIALACNLVLRAAPLYRWLRSHIEAGGLGRLYAWDGEYLYGRIERITEGWRKDVPNYSVMQGGAIHLVDLLLWLAGERPTEVQASGNRVCTEGTAFQHDDYRTALLRFPSGLVGRITANFGCVHRHQHVVRAFGTRGTFLHDDAGSRMHTSRDPTAAPQPVPHASLPPTKGDLVPWFLDAATGALDIRADTRAFFDGVSVAAACDEAALTGNSEKVKYV